MAEFPGRAVPQSLLRFSTSRGCCCCRPPAFISDKMTRAQAQYEDTPSGIYGCGMYSLFEAPNACKVVEGEIGKDGWCKAFALRID